MIEGRRTTANTELYFDHDPEDQTTAMFFKMQRNPPPKIRRAYHDEGYAIIDAVAAGWGRAAVPKHSPVYSCYDKQPFYPKLQQAISQEIQRNVSAYLEDAK